MSGPFGVIIAAAGRSRRYGDPHVKKPFAMLADRAVWLHSADRFLAHRQVGQVIVAVAPEDREYFTRKFGANLAFMEIELSEGGRRRSDTVKNAIALLNDQIEYVAVHDAARPCVSEQSIAEVFDRARATGAAILATPVADTLKRADAAGDAILETVDRRGLWAAQTPQVFRRNLLEQAYHNVGDGESTDDAQLIEAIGEKVTLVDGSPLNIKITTQRDLRLAEQILKVLPKPKPPGRNPLADDDLWR